MSNQVTQPFEVFFNRDGLPVENGYIYVGEKDQNPETNPIPVFWDQALSIPAAQPVRTLNGYLSRNGSPGKLYVSSSEYSITVRDKNRTVIYTDRNATGSAAGGNILQLQYTNGASESLASTSTDMDAGGLVQTGHYDSNNTIGSGATFQATGASNSGKAGNCPDADGYFYDAGGRRFAIVGNAKPAVFGVMSNGSTDDTQGWRAALAAAAALGVTVECQETPNYSVITSSLVVQSGLIAVGNGQKIEQKSPASNIFHSTADLEDVDISGFVFKPGPSSTSLYNGNCINFMGSCTRVSVHSNKFYDLLNSGILMIDSTDCAVYENQFISSRTVPGSDYTTSSTDIALFGSGYRNKVYANMCASGGGYAIGLQTLEGKPGLVDNIISNNTVDGYEGYGIYIYLGAAAGGAEPKRGNIIDGNTVSNITGSLTNGGIKIYGTGIYNQGPEGSIISNNYVYNTSQQTVAETLAPAGIGSVNSKGLLVTGNYVVSCNKRGIMLKDTNSSGSDIWSIVSNNIVEDSGDDGIRLTDMARVLVEGNTVTGAGHSGIRTVLGFLSALEKLTIKSNSCYASGVVGFNLAGLVDSEVRGNASFDSTTYGFNITGMDNSFVHGNIAVGSGDYGFRFASSTYGDFRGNSARDNSGTHDYHINSDSWFDNSNFGTSDGDYRLIRTASDGDSTPSVRGTRILRIQNSGATTITDFDDGVAGQEILVVFVDAVTTIDFTGTNLKGNNGSDYTTVVNQSMQCVKDAAFWRCIVS